MIECTVAYLLYAIRYFCRGAGQYQLTSTGIDNGIAILSGIKHPVTLSHLDGADPRTLKECTASDTLHAGRNSDSCQPAASFKCGLAYRLYTLRDNY